jgi:uncharacterized membrane protein
MSDTQNQRPGDPGTPERETGPAGIDPIPPSVEGASSRKRPTTSTAGRQMPAPGAAPGPLVRAMRRLEDDGRLDGLAGPLDAAAAAVVRSPAVANALRGTWLGHALHPLLTDFPLGAWASASFLDLFGGTDSRPASQRLVGFGLLAAVPTAAAGLAEWRHTAGGARRVGVVHAGVNSAATVLYGSSWLARRRGAHGAAVVLGVAGGVVATAGGYFGGHLSLVRKIGTADPSFGTDR